MKVESEKETLPVNRRPKMAQAPHQRRTFNSRIIPQLGSAAAPD
jgi:hypothetical protein